MSRHKCTTELYKAFLQATCVRYSGLALSEVSPYELSHDSISRWLQDRHFRPNEVWSITEDLIDKKEPNLLIVDNSVLAKPYSNKIDLVTYQYSGNAHDVIAGIGLVNFLWYGLDSEHAIPIDYRVYDKDSDGKTKNNHFCDMLSEAKKRGLIATAVVFDAWYSSLKNLKAIRDHGWVWVTNLRKNRKVNRNVSLEDLDIPDEGEKVHLRGYGWVTVFKFVAKNGRIDYITTNMDSPTRDVVERIAKARWSIEVYHRELKQTCGIERCQARTGRAQRNHICLAIKVWIDQHMKRIRDKTSFYEQGWQVIKGAIADSMRATLAMT